MYVYKFRNVCTVISFCCFIWKRVGLKKNILGIKYVLCFSLQLLFQIFFLLQVMCSIFLLFQATHFNETLHYPVSQQSASRSELRWCNQMEGVEFNKNLCVMWTHKSRINCSNLCFPQSCNIHFCFS
jgi:hypothetical protein